MQCGSFGFLQGVADLLLRAVETGEPDSKVAPIVGMTCWPEPEMRILCSAQVHPQHGPNLHDDAREQNDGEISPTEADDWWAGCAQQGGCATGWMHCIRQQHGTERCSGCNPTSDPHKTVRRVDEVGIVVVIERKQFRDAHRDQGRDELASDKGLRLAERGSGGAVEDDTGGAEGTDDDGRGPDGHGLVGRHGELVPPRKSDHDKAEAEHRADPCPDERLDLSRKLLHRADESAPFG